MRATSLLLAAVSTAIALPAAAETTSQSFFTNGTFSVTPFDTTLGTLNSVTVSYTGTSRFLVPLNGPPSPGANYVISNFISLYVGPLFFDGTATGSGPITGNGPVELVSNLLVPDVGTRSDAFALNVFQTSGLSGYVAYDPPSTSTITGASLNFFQLQKAGASANATITYTYTPFGGAVPEPATWSMMIAGFGLVGGAMRKRLMTAM